ncbi:hypothetical protein [Asticcacaulis sp. 201]|uniref:hypothetical protein n=1 Tax=Asticcacaulis sp. 201 TaxID=3028787 RepID=UPI002916F66D|nr:hypothetical protein [Asticcacaulis sp. 201]MDV6331242.1 hypothetical protein [Asticcacaulis sp. 201]
MLTPEPRQLIFEREVGGVEGELTIICHPADKKTQAAPKGDMAPPELSPDQAYICDHATD